MTIDAVYGVGSPCFNELHHPWVCGLSNFLNVTYSLELLRYSILDAWLGCYPDVPADDDEFIVINLTRCHLVFWLIDVTHFWGAKKS